MTVQLLVGSVLKRAARVAPETRAATLGDQSLTFAQLDQAAGRLATVLARKGVGRGTRVAWHGPMSLDAVVLFAALARRGAAFVPVNSRLASQEVSDVVAQADPHLVLSGDDLAELVTDNAPPERPDLSVEETDTHVIFFTSGSTGRPKGVVLSHRANVLRSMAANTTTPHGATVCMFPLFHMASWTIALGAWQVAEEVVFVQQADAPTLLAAVEARRARRLYAIPAVWNRVLSADLGSFDLSSLTEVDTGTSATPPELLAALRAAFPNTVTRVLYGSTEAGAGTVLGVEDIERKPGSVGRPAPGVEVRLTDEGEVTVRSAFLMDGYFRDDESTASALVDGWYQTGDLGVMDAEGYLSIVGRRRDVIRTGGETVAPPEVETVVASHPAVADVAVVGLPDATWGEIVCAAVVLRPGGSLDLAGLQQHCDGRLARFKVPRRLIAVDALPRTAATGQIQRSLLIERLGMAAG